MKRAAFWIVSEEKYADEAQASATELREFMPDLRLVLFTCEHVHQPHAGAEVFDSVVFIPPPTAEYWYLDSVKYFNLAFDWLRYSGYEQALYLDTDVNFISPFPEVFDMLERFDIVAPMGSRRVTGGTFEKLPACFPEYEIGVVAFVVCHTVEVLFKLWKELHWAHPDVYGNNDMRSFREAVWKSPNVKIERLPTEYGLRWPFGCYMSLPVKILHGRELGGNYPDSPTVEEVKAIVNSHFDMRIWSPRDPRWRDGVIPPADWLEGR